MTDDYEKHMAAIRASGQGDRNDPKQWRNHQMAMLIAQEIRNLLLQYPELEEDEVLRADMVEGETNAFEFLAALEARRQNDIDEIDMLQLGIDRRRKRQVRFERRVEALRLLMFKTMEIAKLKKAQLPSGEDMSGATLSIRAGTPKVIITDESKLPDMYWRIKKEPDKIKLGNDLKEGRTIAGAELSNAEPVLNIRT